MNSLKATKGSDPDLYELFQIVADLRNRDECEKFLEDLCTPMELRSMADRWKVVKMLRQGVPYRVIYEKTGVSTATITRVGRTLNLGTGGYNLMLERVGEKSDRKK